MLTVAGASYPPESAYGWVSFIEHEDGEKHLGPHGLRPGTDGLSFYSFLLRSLAEFVQAGTPIHEDASALPFHEAMDDTPNAPLQVATPKAHELLARYGSAVDMGSFMRHAWSSPETPEEV